jgi:hypothetical protein
MDTRRLDSSQLKPADRESIAMLKAAGAVVVALQLQRSITKGRLRGNP